MQYTPFIPSEPPLHGRVDTLFILDDYEPEHPRERIVPDGTVNLIIELDGRERFVFDNRTGEPLHSCRGSWISGVHTNYLTIGDTSAGSTLAVTQFSLGRARALLHQDLSEINDRVAPATELLGNSVVRLRDQLLAAGSAGERLAILDSYWTQRFDPTLDAPAVVQDAVNRLKLSPGEINITQLVDDHREISHRHFVALFKRHIGPTPKRLQRILRFAKVFEHIQAEEGVDWAQTSLELGYSDQAHFVREFVEFSGFRPQEYLKLGHDRSNFFPEDERS